jgi:hypothetical protein
MWDAEHEPANVGLSHNVLARTIRDGAITVVEAITKVESVDLVADPATTRGLFEQTDPEPEAFPAPHPPHDARPLEIRWEALTPALLEQYRPDLVSELRRTMGGELGAREQLLARRERVHELLLEHELPLPRSNSSSSVKTVGQAFYQSLMNAADDDAVRQLVEERAALVKSLREHTPDGSGQPTSRDQLAVTFPASYSRINTARDFALAVRA